MADAIIDIPLPVQALGKQTDRQKSALVAGAASHFLVGPENRLVQVAVRSALEEKPNGYNPLVFYGPSGTGKSHLASGIAAAWKTRNRRRAECVAAVDFARELAEAIETQAVEEFRAKYRKTGLFVFEDLGRLVNRKSEKLSVQDELVHTLDALIDRGSWIIVTSLSAPVEMRGILPALQSRLIAGLTVPLAPPDAQTRLLLLQSMADSRQIELSESAARMLAQGLAGTVPELRGALLQLEVSGQDQGGRIHVHDVRAFLERRNSQNLPSIATVATACAKHCGLKLTQLRSSSRQQAVVTARNIAIFLSRKIIHCSFAELGGYFGARDHTTIIHSWRKMEKLMQTDAVIRHEIDKIEAAISGTKTPAHGDGRRRQKKRKSMVRKK
ncbi:MAG: DnaA/Hda family protein [Thermoguttaceae bacterium]